MKIAIVGGAGKMGRWLARNLIKQSQQVMLIDHDEAGLEAAGRLLNIETTTELRAVGYAEAFVLSVPISRFEGIVRDLSPFACDGQMAFDITSVKAMPVDVMHRYFPHCLVLGTHPVFGPGAEGVDGQSVVLTPASEPEKALADKLGKILEGHGATVSVMTPEKHDELMAVVLGLAHFIAIVAGDTLLSLDSIGELKKVSGPTFRALLSLVTSVLHEDPELYAAIQMNLPVLPGLEQAFVREAGTWADLVSNRDSAGFIEKMSALRRVLEEQP